MEDKRSSRHRRTSSSPRSSWGDGIKLTKEIFENCIPYSDAKARTVENVSKAFHENNQKFLKGAQATNKHSAADILLSQFMISPPSR